MNEFLLPKNHIANLQDLADFQCMICYEIDTDLVRCKGPCKQIFCLHCTTRFKIKSNICPNRCSDPCLFEPVPNLSILFKCPFDSQQCKETLIGADKFRGHCQECQFMSKDFKKEMKRNKEFKCLKDHRLLFLNQATFYEIYGHMDFFNTTLNEICHLCNSQTVCTSICKQCSTPEKKCVFCIKCRFLPCTKTQCPIGHSYIERNIVNKSTICDFCGLAVSIFGSKSFRDENCNFDICQNCNKNLPEVHPLVPLQQNAEKEKINLFNWLNILNMGTMINGHLDEEQIELPESQSEGQNPALAEDQLNRSQSEEQSNELANDEEPSFEEEDVDQYQFPDNEDGEEEQEFYDIESQEY